MTTRGASGRTRLMKTVVSAALVLLLAAVLFTGAASAATHEVSNAADLAGFFANASAGDVIKLTASFQMNGEITVNKQVTLDLNGNTLTAADNKRLFTVGSSGNFTLQDSLGGGKLTGGRPPGYDFGGGVHVDGGSFTMTSGSITNCTTSGGSSGGGVCMYNSGTFTMTGGTIADCAATSSGGGVWVSSGSSFTMSGDASIINCTAIAFVASNGGGVYVGGNNGGTFIMSGDASIINCTASSSGGGVDVWYGGSFTMTSGSISNCTTINSGYGGGGVYVSQGGTFDMSGGSISDCTATSQGGGVGVGDYTGGSSFTMSGGSISDCTAAYSGGGVYINNNCSFTMTGGSIEDCSAVQSGGGVYVLMSSFTMSGGSSISDCTATGGGGVLVTMSSFTMSGGSISGCTATGGGGVLVSMSTFTMTGGSISDCTASGRGGGGVSVSGGTFTISGTALVAENNDAALPSPGDTFITSNGFTDANAGVKNITLYYRNGNVTELNATAWVGQTVVKNSVDTSRFKLSSVHTGLGFSLSDSGSNNLTVTGGSPVPPVPPVAPSSEYHNLGAGIWCTYDEERNVYTLLPEAAIPSSAYSSNPFSAAADGPLASPSISIGSLPASAYNVTFLGWRNEDVKIIEVQPGINLTGGSGAFAAFTNAELSYFGDGTEPARDVFGAGRLIYPVNATNSSEILPNGHYTGRAMTLETDWAVAGQKVKIAVIPENGYAVYDWKLHKGEYKTGDLITPVENYIERINDPDYGSTTYVLTMPNSAVTVEPVLRDQGSTIVVYLFIDADSYVLEIPADFNIKKQDLPVTDKMVNLTACDMLPGHVLNVNMTSEGGYRNLGISGVGSTFVMSNIRSSADKAGYTIAKKQIYKGETGFKQITSNGNIVLSTEGFDAESLEEKLMEGNMKTELEFTLKGVTNQNTLGKYKDKLTFTVEIES